MAACYLELTLEQNEETEMMISFILLQGKIFHGKKCIFCLGWAKKCAYSKYDVNLLSGIALIKFLPILAALQ